MFPVTRLCLLQSLIKACVPEDSTPTLNPNQVNNHHLFLHPILTLTSTSSADVQLQPFYPHDGEDLELSRLQITSLQGSHHGNTNRDQRTSGTQKWVGLKRTQPEFQLMGFILKVMLPPLCTSIPYLHSVPQFSILYLDSMPRCRVSLTNVPQICRPILLREFTPQF